MQPEGIALGLERGKVFLDVIEDQQITMAKGDFVILYTDGFVEAMNRDRIEYGEERLLQTIREHTHLESKALIDTVCREVIRFADDHPQHDDMTMISVKAI
jgi:sigma-B regulation protein RsbU (phosphoserine phosphatase)